MVSVSYLVNKYVAPFVMGFSTAAFSVSTDPVAIFVLFVIAIGAGILSLPKADRMIERCFDAMI
jgi:hypothetical protein